MKTEESPVEELKQNKRRLKIGEILISQGLVNQEQLDQALVYHQQSGVSIGQVILRMGLIDAETLNNVLGRQFETSVRKRLGEILIEFKLISAEQLKEALERQKNFKLPLGKTLIKLGYLQEDKLLDVIAAQLNLQHVVLENFKFDQDHARLVSHDMARAYKMIPLYLKGGILTVAMADPTNLRSLDHIKFKTGKEVEPVIASEQEIMAAIDKVYGGAVKEKLTDMLKQSGIGEDDVAFEQVKDEDEEEEQLADEEGRQIVKIVNLIVTEAIRLRASDIHLEPQERHLRVRYRIDGELAEQNSMPARFMNQIVSRLKVIGGMDIAEKRKPLDGRSNIKYQGKEVDLRLSTFPTLLRGRGVAEKMVIRIIDPNSEIKSLAKIGFSPSLLTVMENLLELPDGIILVTGPTGSGKSSTLYTFVDQVNKPGVNIVTMEDPVEKNISGINQGQINNGAGFTFAAGIRSILRQDPDIIMVGEMRDKETSEMAVQAALTGHLVFSTLHTNDAAGAFTRLLDMGVEPFLVTSCVKGVLAQRLVRTICDKCRHPVQLSEALLKTIGVPSGTPFFQGKGCSACNNSGYRGRMAIFEVLTPDETICQMVLERRSSDEIKSHAIHKMNMSTLRRDGLEKAMAGLTTVEQVVSASQADM